MSQYLESIRIEQGKASLIAYHQARVERTLGQYGDVKLDLYQAFAKLKITDTNLVYKWRIIYGSDAMYTSSLTPYTVKSIRSLALVESTLDYSYKYADRATLDHLYDTRQNCDDILILKNGLVTDTSYGNVAFYAQGKWHTPATPLLAGCQRSQLLESGCLYQAVISIDDYKTYSHISIFNAMIPLGRILLPTAKILNFQM
jgi:4-amino-4-deoxychorismate lyase